jgi:hypothetical protein
MAKKAKRASKSAGKSRRKSTRKPARKSARFPGMMGDGTEEQNLNQRGNPGARIRKSDVVAAFGKKRSKKRT